MSRLQKFFWKSVTPPAAIVDNASLTCAAIDTRGYGFVKIVAYLGATDIATTTMKLTESDDDSSYSDMSGSTFGTSTDAFGSTSALPTATDDNKPFVWFVNTAGKKRYIKPSITCGDGAAGTYICVFAECYDGKSPLTSKTEMGLGGAIAVI